MRIDFVEPYRPSRRMWAFALIPWMLTTLLWVIHMHLQARIEQRQMALHAQEEASARAAITPAPPAPPYLQDALAAMKRARQPEADAMRELESVAVVGVQLRSIDVNADASMVTVELEATDDKALGDYLDQLNTGLPQPLWHIRQISATSGSVSANSGAGTTGGQESRSRAATIVRNL
jgi:hypothetical protein